MSKDIKKIQLTAVVGPTASGKTSLGVFLAKKFSGEIVSADSMQIYKGIPIAAAVPSNEEMQGIPHHLIEIVPTYSAFSASNYVNLARKTITEVNKRGNMPILVGGTGLYVNSLVDGTEFLKTDTDYELRRHLQEQMDRMGSEKMLDRLAEFDPKTAKKLHPNNHRRIIRAFEVYESSGITLSKQNELSHLKGSEYDSFIIGITYKNREKLYERIERRVDEMLEKGLLYEARQALDSAKIAGASQVIGHKEFNEYFKGNESLEAAVLKLKAETRHYAKRQLTWFGKRQDIEWIYADEQDPQETSAKIINRRRNGG